MDFIYRPDFVTQRFVTLAGLTLLIMGFIVWITGITKGASPECRVFPQALEFAPRLNATIRVRGNSSCRIPLLVQSGSIESLQLSMPPEGGVVTLNPDGVSYRPGPNFRGLDFFAFPVRGHSTLFDGTSVAKVHVFVR